MIKCKNKIFFIKKLTFTQNLQKQNKYEINKLKKSKKFKTEIKSISKRCFYFKNKLEYNKLTNNYKRKIIKNSSNQKIIKS